MATNYSAYRIIIDVERAINGIEHFAFLAFWYLETAVYVSLKEHH